MEFGHQEESQRLTSVRRFQRNQDPSWSRGVSLSKCHPHPLPVNTRLSAHTGPSAWNTTSSLIYLGLTVSSRQSSQSAPLWSLPRPLQMVGETWSSVFQQQPPLQDELPMACSPPDSSVHGILQVRILESVAIPFSRGSSRSRDWTWVSCIAGRFFTIWATREAQYNYCQDVWLSH